MSNVRCIGLDVHAETIAVAVAEPDGAVRSLGVIPNRPDSIRRLMKKLGPVAGFGIPTGIRALTEHQQSVTGKSFAAWRHPAVNLQQMVQDADVIAVVTATASYPGRVATSHQGESTHEFELVDFTVSEVVKGSAGGTLTVERDADVQNGRRVTSPDGGPFGPGTDHLIFLKKQPGTPYFILMNDQGRYAVGRGGRLESIRQGPVSAELRAKQLPEALGLVRRFARTP